MFKKLIAATAMTTALSLSGQVAAQAPICSDLEWSENVFQEYPDIAKACRGVFEKDGKLYAKATIEVLRVRGNRITFRLLETDGGKGNAHSITVPGSWRAMIAGRKYRAGDIVRGQALNVYVPEDRWGISVHDASESGPDQVHIEVLEVEGSEH